MLPATMALKTSRPGRYVLAGVLAVLVVAALIESSRLRDVLLGFLAVGAVASLVLVLFVNQSRWRQLLARYPAVPPFAGPWRRCRTTIVSRVALGEPGYRRHKVVFIFAMQVGADPQGLYLSGASVFRLLLPPIRLPWSAIVRVRHFEANAWNDRPPSLHTVQFVYDPGYSGPFVEIEVADPKTFIQLPVEQIKEAVAHLPA